MPEQVAGYADLARLRDGDRGGGTVAEQMHVHHVAKRRLRTGSDGVVDRLSTQPTSLEPGPEGAVIPCPRKARPDFGQVADKPGNQVSGHIRLDRLAGLGLAAVE